MAFRRRFAPPRGKLRVKRQGAWTGGFEAAQSLTAATSVGFVLWDINASQGLNTPGKFLHRVTYLHFGLRPGSFTTQTLLYWYLYVFKTDASGNVPSAAIFPASSSSNLVAEKGLMDRGFQYYLATAGAAYAGDARATLHREMKAKRRMEEDDALVLVVESLAGVTNGFDLMWRTYMSW